jgi:hypothetical protein
MPLAIRSENVLATDLFCPDELLYEEHHVKTITRSFAGSGVHLRDSERARTAAHSSTNANSARQRDDQRPNRSFAGESTSGLGIRSQRHIHRHH